MKIVLNIPEYFFYILAASVFIFTLYVMFEEIARHRQHEANIDLQRQINEIKKRLYKEYK